jgi:hypothetical protein
VHSVGPTLILKALTHSDTSFGVSKSGRVVLPRAQVEGCLEQLLRLGGANAAAASLKNNMVPRLSVNLSILDEENTEYIVTLKTWQNVVSGQHRPTFVLENTASFMDAYPMKPGDILAICVTPESRLQLRTDMRMVEAPNAGLKRKLSLTSSNGAAGSGVGTAATTTGNANGSGVFKRSRGNSLISLKRNNTNSISPPTPAPSSPHQQNDTMIPHSSADLAAATALMFMSSDTSSSFSLTTTTTVGGGNKNDEAISSSGVSGSSPVGDHGEISMESQVLAAAVNSNTAAKLKIKATKITYTPRYATTGTNKGINSIKSNSYHQSSLPAPPLPAPTAPVNHHHCPSVNPLVSPFQEALLNYSMETLDNLPRFLPQEESTYVLNRRQQYNQQQRQRSQSSNAVGSTTDEFNASLAWASHHHQQHDASINLPVVQSGASVWPSMMSHAAMVVANAMHNFRLSQYHHQQQQEQQQAHHNNVRLVQNQHQNLAIRNASPELPHVSMAAAAQHSKMPLALGGGGGGDIKRGGVIPSPVEGLLARFVH